MTTPNAATRAFVEELRARPEVQGVLLFGSWARGNPRPRSDVDLVVIVREGYFRGVEIRGDQAFEIIRVTEAAAYEFWESHRHDAAGLWEVAEILYDADGTMARLETRARAMLAEGCPRLDAAQLAHARFDAEDLLRHVEDVVDADPATASMLLARLVERLTEVAFESRGAWIVPPKQRLARIGVMDPELGADVRRFFVEPLVGRRLELARRIVARSFAR
jgi:predicted nucleotidyltransferase